MWGVLVSSEKHTIKMFYLPISFQIDFGISIATIAGLLLFLLKDKVVETIKGHAL
jgi:hypothetical protein